MIGYKIYIPSPKIVSHSDIKTIYFVFSNFNAHTKHEIAKVISENVEYMKEWEIEKRKCFEGESHIAGAFDAVSLGITHFI